MLSYLDMFLQVFWKKYIKILKQAKKNKQKTHFYLGEHI